MSLPPDQRRGAPSASGLRRLRNCPYSHTLEKQVPEIESKMAQSGDKVHAALAGTLPPLRLSIQEVQTFEMCSYQETQLRDEWLGETAAEPHETIREHRLGLTAFGTVLDVTPECTADFIFTGQGDVIFIQGNRGLGIDHKSLYGDVPDAVDNEQLAGLAPLYRTRYGLDSLTVAIVQPRVGKPTVAHYDKKGLDLAQDWLVETLDQVANATEKDLRAWTPKEEGSNWCSYCKARFLCPAFKAAVHEQLETVNPVGIAGLPGKEQRAAMYARLMDMPAERHFAAWRGLSMVKRYVDALESSAKDRAAADPEFQKFATLQESGRGDREIKDAQAAFERLASLGVTEADMLAASKLRIGDIQEAVRVRSGVKAVTARGTSYNLTAKGAEQAMESALGDVMQRKPPSLELVPVERLPA